MFRIVGHKYKKVYGWDSKNKNRGVIKKIKDGPRDLKKGALRE